ncbi:hypothetical protein D3C73_1131400 [compost metagenome]
MATACRRPDGVLGGSMVVVQVDRCSRPVLMRFGRQIEHTAEVRLLFGLQRVVGHGHLGRSGRSGRRDRGSGSSIVPARQIVHRCRQFSQRVFIKLTRPPLGRSGIRTDFRIWCVMAGSAGPGRHRRFLTFAFGRKAHAGVLLGQGIQRGTCRQRCRQAGGIVFLAQRRQRRGLATTQQPGAQGDQHEQRQAQPVPRRAGARRTRRLCQALLRGGQVIVLHRDQ